MGGGFGVVIGWYILRNNRGNQPLGSHINQEISRHQLDNEEPVKVLTKNHYHHVTAWPIHKGDIDPCHNANRETSKYGVPKVICQQINMAIWKQSMLLKLPGSGVIEATTALRNLPPCVIDALLSGAITRIIREQLHAAREWLQRGEG